MSSCHFVPVLCLLASIAVAQVQRSLNELVPPNAEFHQSQIKKVEELRGKLVLVCLPRGEVLDADYERSVAGLVDEFRVRGFEALVLTGAPISGPVQIAGGEVPLDELRRSEVRWLIASCGGSPFMIWNNSFRSLSNKMACLFSPADELVWKGNVTELPKKLIEQHIKKARISSHADRIALDVRLPASQSKIVDAAAKGQLGKAMKEAEKAIKSGKLFDREVLEVRDLDRMARAIHDRRRDRARALLKDSRAHDALESLEELAQVFKSHSLARGLQKEARGIRADKSLKDELAAGKQIARALDLAGKGKKAAAIRVLEKLGKGRLAKTKEAARASAIRLQLQAD